MVPLLIFTYGVVGGIAPEIIRVRKIVQEDKTFSYSRSLLVVSCFVALLGGVIAVALEANTPLNAIWIGVSAPVIISNMVKNPPEQALKGAKLKKVVPPITYDLLESREASGPVKKGRALKYKQAERKPDLVVREPVKMEADNKLAQGVKKVRDYLGRL